MVSTDPGYSGTPQLKKLGIRVRTRLDLIGAEPDWRFEVDPVDAVATPTGSVDVVLAFVRTRAELDAAVEHHEQRIHPAGALWIAWPRKAAGHVSEVTENLIRDVVLPRGLVDVKVAAIDTDWSGLKVVWRTDRR